MDIWVALHRENAEKIVNVLIRFGFGAMTGTSVEMFLQANQVVRMGNPPLRIEILTGISGVNFADCFGHRMDAVLDDVPVNVISLADLKANKKASGRAKDLNDLKHLP
jgi:hypothetical protein